ncbi:MAG: virulence protein E [Bacteroidales bacterium]|nr:virulence protein E [Bacteroidales bacterium]MBP3235624.1 virulence protein E [Bacteroidales bacterium]
MLLHLEDDYNPYGRKDEKPFGPRFSFFRAPITNTRPHKSISLSDAYAYIHGHYAAEQTRQLRAIKDSSQARIYKAAHFDYATFCGQFKSRSDKEIIQPSGLICLDFDHLSDVEGLFQALLQDEYFETELLFRSPSGHGLKWVVPIAENRLTHAEYFRRVANYIKQTYRIEVDKSGKDLSRACFLPCDPLAYINPKYAIK